MAVIGVDIGGTKILAAIVVDDGPVGAPVRVPTPAGGPDAVLAAVTRAIEAVRTDDSTAVGVGTAGAVDANGRITHATATVPGWLGTEVRAELIRRVGLPVTVRNDVHAMALGEARSLGAGTILVVAAGTGVGGALLVDGRLVPGAHGLAGSVGHLPATAFEGRPCGCGGIDHVEAYAAGPAIATDYAYRRGLTGAIALEDVAAAASGGDRAAVAAIELGARILGRGLAAAANLFDPTTIVLGGGVLNLGSSFLNGVRTAFTAMALSAADLRPAALGDVAVLAGAAFAARLESSPA